MKKLLASLKSKNGKGDKKLEKPPSLQRGTSQLPKIPDPELQYSFEAIKLLGHGSTGETWLCRELRTQQLVAVKLIPRPFPKALLPEHVEREIKARLLAAFAGLHSVQPRSAGQSMVVCGVQIQTELGDSHINIINALEVIMTANNLALVLEYAEGGSLTSYVSSRWQHAQHMGSFLSEDEARFLFRVSLLLLGMCLHDHPQLLTEAAIVCSNSSLL